MFNLHTAARFAAPVIRPNANQIIFFQILVIPKNGRNSMAADIVQLLLASAAPVHFNPMIRICVSCSFAFVITVQVCQCRRGGGALVNLAAV